MGTLMIGMLFAVVAASAVSLYRVVGAMGRRSGQARTADDALGHDRTPR